MQQSTANAYHASVPMDYAYRFCDARKLYLNVTNRCTNRCSFCVRYRTQGLAGAILWGKEEPDFSMLQAAIKIHGSIEEFDEFVWCGYGEPTFRLDLIKEAAPWLRSKGAKIRLDTNGHACLIHRRDVLAELSQALDSVSISMNAPNCRRYLELCRSDASVFDNAGFSVSTPVIFWDEMLDFLFRSPVYFEYVQASVVGWALSQEEIEQSRSLARSLGVKHFRVR
jgi:TatD DNase family protein